VRIVDEQVVRHGLSTLPSKTDPAGRTRLQACEGRTVVGAHRHGKRLALELTGADSFLAHLGMTGKWARRPELPKHGRVGLGDVWFVDTRRFGCLTWVSTPLLQQELRRGLGPDALTEPLGPTEMAGVWRGRRAIKVAMLDQTRVAGIGNIQASETLWRAGVSPLERCDDVKPWSRIAAELPVQLARTLAAIDRDEVAYMSDGDVPNPFEVYGREGEDCRRCGTPIVRAVQAGRATFWCPACQPRHTSA